MLVLGRVTPKSVKPVGLPGWVSVRSLSVTYVRIFKQILHLDLIYLVNISRNHPLLHPRHMIRTEEFVFSGLKNKKSVQRAKNPPLPRSHDTHRVLPMLSRQSRQSRRLIITNSQLKIYPPNISHQNGKLGDFHHGLKSVSALKGGGCFC